MTAATAIEALATFASRESGTVVPSSMHGKVRYHLLDTIGNMLLARNSEIADVALHMARRVGGVGRSTVVGRGATDIGPIGAALANGIAAHCLEFDDTHLGAVVHPSAVVVPSALAMAEANDNDVGELVDAIAIGWEVLCRVGIAVGGELDRIGFHATGVLGPLGAGATAGRLLGLSCERIASALGLCCSQGAGTNQAMADGSWNKAFHAGWAAFGGTAAAIFADSGFCGSKNGLDGNRGLLRVMTASASIGDAAIGEGLGDVWSAEHVVAKRYGCGHLIHSYLDCVEILAERRAFDLDDIEKVLCIVAHESMPLVGQPASSIGTEDLPAAGRFSIPYCVAMRLVGMEVRPEDFGPSLVRHAQVRELARRVECLGRSEPGYPARYPGEVLIRFRDRSEIGTHVANCQGTPERPFPQHLLVKKFCRNARTTMCPTAAESFAHRLLTCSEHTRVRQLVEELGARCGEGCHGQIVQSEPFEDRPER